ncbi:MAG: RICIN domain-containing protein, partial [Lachnospira sp.]
MQFIKKHKKLITMLTAVLLIAVSLGTYVSQTWAAYDTWNSLVELEFRTGLGEGQHSLTDVMTYSGNYTNDVGEIYSDRSHFFDDIRLDTMSRVTYARKVRVASGQCLTIVAAREDTADAGGLTENAGLQFYWSVCEYDENGNIVFDGGWRSSSGTWIVGVTENGDTGYGKSGYPNGEDINTRQNKVRYVVPIFRWNNGDESAGSGDDLTIRKEIIANKFPVFTMITDPFTYTFNLNGGQVNGSGSAVTMQRLGIENVSVPATPTRPGYVFTGWKITSTGGKQAGKVYDAGQLAEMFTDGKYWSSLFADATFEAQWVQADCFVSYMGNRADNMSDFYRSYNAAYDGNTAENFLFKRTGYTSVSSTWEIKDQFLNLTGGCDGGGTLPSSGTLTSIRTKCGGRYQCVDISAASYADGANAQIWDCVNGNAQMYAFVFAGFEDGLPYWVIRNNATGKVLDAAIGTGIDGGNNGANIQQWAYHGGDNQKWTLQMAGDGYFYIRSKLDPNLVLDLLYGSTDNGTNLQLCNYYGSENQQWYLWDNTINLSAEWTNSNYKVDYNADGGTLLDENGNETTDTVRTYEYDRIYNFLKAKRAYTVSYETNGGTAAINSSNTDAPGTFNGWNEQLTAQTSHGEVQGSYDWTTGTLNWAAYYNGNPDILNAAGNVYDTIRAIMHYRAFGISENRQFTGDSYWLPSVRFKNLTADGGTVNVKADYTNGSVTLPDAEKASVEIDGKNVSYTFDGWYLDPALTNRVGGAGDTYTPAGNTTLYAKYTTQSENLIFNQKIRVRYENADGTWTSYSTIFDQDFRTGDTVDYDFGSLDTDKWVRPAAVKYTVSGQYQTEGYTTSVDIYRQTYNVTVTYDNADAFSAKSGEGTYRWGENVTASVTLSEKTAQYTYRFAGFETDSRLTFRNGTTAASNPVTFVMPEENVTLKACSASQTNEYTVTVEHYYMDTAGNYPDKPSVAEDLTPYYGETLVHKNLAREIKGLSFNENKTIQENGNRTQTEVKGNTTVRLYYDRTVCTVTYDYRTNGGTSADKETVKTYYGADADLSVAAYKNGWEHAGWNTKSDSE